MTLGRETSQLSARIHVVEGSRLFLRHSHVNPKIFAASLDPNLSPLNRQATLNR
jgi:hypothetical protein